MTVKRNSIAAVLALFAMASHAAAAEHDHSAHSHEAAPAAVAPAPAAAGKINLSPALKELLAQEMQAIQEGMRELAPAIASGDGAAVAKIGAQMKKSYILSQKLSKAQMEELHAALPKDFAVMDHEFHDFAGMMAGAAESGQWNVVPYLFYRLAEGCVNCHGSYAHEKFPSLAGKGTGRRHMASMHSSGNMDKGQDGAEAGLSNMKEQCAMGMMGKHEPGAHIAKECMKDGAPKECMQGDKNCPMDEKGNCVMDQCEKGKKGDCPMMEKKPEGQEAEKKAAPAK